MLSGHSTLNTVVLLGEGMSKYTKYIPYFGHHIAAARTSAAAADA
jgi:hypothetical protein